jgi:hypothetical protein
MEIFIVFGVLLLGLLVAMFFWSKTLERRIAERDKEIARLTRVSEEARQHYESETTRVCSEAQQHYESETTRVYSEAQASIASAQKLLDQQLAEMTQESERVRQHYDAEARRAKIDADAAISKTIADLEPLRRFEKLRDAEAETQRELAAALNEANSLRAEARGLLEKSRTAAETERSVVLQKAKDIHEQAAARLNQALRDAGRIVAEAEKRAQQIGGDAYTALRDKQTLEQAAQAMRNIIEGYGDRYLVPTHSLLDDLAAEYGYDAAGQSLASAREQTKRMVEQGEAAACDYVEASRRNTAIQFVIHAFNGSVDAILSRAKSDNYGTLEQKIRDCYSIVNRDGAAFRNARILPAFLDARLAELKWVVVVQELAQRDREEQRYLREQERDRQKAEQERERNLREAEKEKQIIEAAMAEAEQRFAAASVEQKAETEKQLQELRQKLEDATKRELTIAQQTSKGRIYVISNVGSFGDGVYKIGLTRRPASERVDELNNASVPFEFDIHAVIETDDAPTLEYKIHQQFILTRMNKINPRKEFFRVSLSDIRQVVDKLVDAKDITTPVQWLEKARAQQYYESLDIEHDPQAREKWLKRARLLAERRERAMSRISLYDAEPSAGGHEEPVVLVDNSDKESVSEKPTSNPSQAS